jgi:hypothetical protein
MFCNFFCIYANVIIFLVCFGLGFLLAIVVSHFGLDVVYYLRYLYVMCCMCDDNNNCRC